MRERTILYIEDNLGNQNLMRAIFETVDDWHLIISGTAEAGIDLSRTSQPDIILMDINLPGMSGYDALAVLKHDPLTSRIPIVAVTATRTPYPDADNSGVRFDAIVLKPFTRDELINPIKHALSAK